MKRERHLRVCEVSILFLIHLSHDSGHFIKVPAFFQVLRQDPNTYSAHPLWADMETHMTS